MLFGPWPRIGPVGVDFLRPELSLNGCFHLFRVKPPRQIVFRLFRLALAIEQAIAAPWLLVKDDVPGYRE